MQHSFLQWEKNNGGMGVGRFVTFQSRLTVLPDNVQIPYKMFFAIDTSQSTGRILLMDGLCNGLLLQKPTDCRTNSCKKKETPAGIHWSLGNIAVGSVWVAQLYANKNLN